MLINVCRICGRSRLCPKAVQLFTSGRQGTLRRIELITGIRLQQIPNAPDMLCFCCQTDLNSAMMFRRTCILQQKKWVPVEEAEELDKMEVQPKEKPKPVLPKRKYQRRKKSSVLPVETVDIVVATDNKASADATGGDEEFDQPVEISTEPESEESDVKLEFINAKEEDSPPKDDEDVDSDLELPNIRTFKCATCGVIKYNKSSLDRHQYEHSGKIPYPCKECHKGFLAASELKAHNLTHHTAEPPFKCRYCERRYFSTAGRKKHERVHTNERPYVCDQCGKGFTRTCILMAHMESHRTIKKFGCQVCNRSFSLKKHLVTHLVSNTHKQNAEFASSASETMSVVSCDTYSSWSTSSQVASPLDEVLQSQLDILCQEI
ncbi:transcription factor Ouib [Drosophila biarmipes]|uniref:transcription factor Ouib n=1 Tax=Drosophila biarmipes TaxID=125945 RepID=UPI0007E703F5|nr:transcription factor Ouib [Drosophila biarmipes]XP_016961544.1 transcription factor Ouib [Drosophila biarmipes]XP_016961545.1 transcription factor Ouib [Drosophila biarmipes]